MMVQWKRLVDQMIWGLYLAAILLCAYVTAYAVATGNGVYAWLGGIGWLVSTAWGLFFRMYVMDVRGKRRKPKGRGTEIVLDPVLGWMHRVYEGKDQWLESMRKGRDI